MPKVTSPDRRQIQEKIVRTLSEVLKNSGFSIRREELKRGFGWKVVSGSCRVNDDRVIFVDKKMSLEEQIVFLGGFLSARSNEIAFPEGALELLQTLGWKGTEQRDVEAAA